MADMKGQVALVTGGNRGIGRAIAARLAQRGCKVGIGYSSNEDSARQVQSDLGEENVSIHQGNIGEAEDCERVVGEVVEQHGKIDILVNNAGVNIDKVVGKLEPDEWDQVIAINLSGAFYLSKRALPTMLENGYGRIVIISSVIGQMGNIGQANYAAAKAGQLGFARTLARETAQKGVTVNAVAPGFIATDMTSGMPEKALEAVKKMIPMGRLGEADEVARVVEFLADPDQGYITGAVFDINGGLNM